MIEPNQYNYISYAQKITILCKNTRRRRIIHLITPKKKKSFKFASGKCKKLMQIMALPITFKVSYGKQLTTRGMIEEIDNEMDCADVEDFNWALQAFVKEYF